MVPATVPRERRQASTTSPTCSTSQTGRPSPRSYYVKDNAASNVDLFLTRYEPGADTFTDFTIQSSGTDTAIRNFTVALGSTPVVVDTTKYSYVLNVKLNDASAETLLYGARVGYTTPAVTPPSPTGSSGFLYLLASPVRVYDSRPAFPPLIGTKDLITKRLQPGC